MVVEAGVEVETEGIEVVGAGWLGADSDRATATVAVTGAEVAEGAGADEVVEGEGVEVRRCASGGAACSLLPQRERVSDQTLRTPGQCTILKLNG